MKLHIPVKLEHAVPTTLGLSRIQDYSGWGGGDDSIQTFPNTWACEIKLMRRSLNVTQFVLYEKREESQMVEE